MIPPADRSIRKIPIPSTRRPRPGAGEEPVSLADEWRREPPPTPPRSGRSRLAMWGAAILALAALLFLGFSVLFAGATITVEPKNEVVSIDGNFTTSPNAPITGLSYQLVTVERDGRETVKAGGTQYVEQRASGTIVISNTYSTATQRLIKNTRFEAPDGKIYRINESVDVPGQKKIDGKTVPGTVEVTVYADSPGESYNRGITDFTIPGFRGDPRYSAFTARSKTPMSGGFVGERRVVSEEERAAAKARIHARLVAELEEAARAEIPDGFVLFPDAFVVSYSTVGEEDDGGDSVTLVERGLLQGILFGNRELAAFIARQSIASYNEEAVALPDTSGLSFIIPQKQSLAFPLEEPLAFALTGQTRIVWQIDTARLKGDLLGREKDALPAIMQAYPVASFRVSTRPFWASALPEDPDRLALVISVPDDVVASEGQ